MEQHSRAIEDLRVVRIHGIRSNSCAALTVLAFHSIGLVGLEGDVGIAVLVSMVLAVDAGIAALDLAVLAVGAGVLGEAGVLAGRGSDSGAGIRSGITPGGGPGPHTDLAITGIPPTTSMFILIRDPPIRTIRTTIQIRLRNKTINTIRTMRAARMAIGSRPTGRALRPRPIPRP